MNYMLIIRPEAEDDLNKAFSWYEDQRKGLGHNFLLQVDAGLRFIERNPQSCPPEYKGARKHLIKRFPYKIVYVVEEAKVIILAVIHGKRNPYLIKERRGII